MVLGGDVVRLFHGDESLTVSIPDSEDTSAGPNLALNGSAPGSPPNAGGTVSTTGLGQR